MIHIATTAEPTVNTETDPVTSTTEISSLPISTLSQTTPTTVEPTSSPTVETVEMDSEPTNTTEMDYSGSGLDYDEYSDDEPTNTTEMDYSGSGLDYDEYSDDEPTNTTELDYSGSGLDYDEYSDDEPTNTTELDYSGSGLDYDDDEDQSTNSPTIGTTDMDDEDFSGSGFDDYFTDNENTTSNGTDFPEDEEQDTTGLMDDEDYGDSELGAVGAHRKKRVAQNPSEKVVVRNKVRDADSQNSPHKTQKLGRKKNRITRRELTDGEDVMIDTLYISDSLQFQEMVKQIVDEESAFERKMDEALAMVKGNREIETQTSVPLHSNFNTHKSASLDISSSELGKHGASNIQPRKNVIPSKVRNKAVGEKQDESFPLRDVFGERIHWEYHDDFDPDKQVPKHE